jgi:hypothetical protein
MRQTIRQLLLLPIGFWMAPVLSGLMTVSFPMAFAAAEDTPTTTVSPTPKSRLLSGMPPLRELVAPPTPAPVIALNSSGFSFSAQQGNLLPSPQILTISNHGRGRLNWSATTRATWLTLSPASGIGNGTVTVTPVLGSLTPATYTGSITLSAPGAQPVSIPVTFTVTPPPVPPTIGVSSPSLSFTAQQGGSNPAPQALNISNTGGGTLTWTANDNAPWLTLSSTTGTGNSTVTVTPALGSLTTATYTGSITLSAPGAQPVSIPVTFTVTPPPTSISLTPSSLNYTGVSGNPNPANQAVIVTSNSTWTASVNAAWLKLSTTSGSGNGIILAGVNLGGLAGTTHTGTITVTAGNTTKTVSVTLTLSTGSLTLSSSNLAFTATQGSGNLPSKDITVQSNGSWTATENASWLLLSQTSGSNHGTITASVDVSKAQQGENQTTLTVASGGIIKTITITLTVGGPLATLAWKPNSETDLAGYKVYRSTTPGKYGPQNVIALVQKNVTTYQATGLQFKTTYYFVVTAFDLAGNESGYSNEVSKSIY